MTALPKSLEVTVAPIARRACEIAHIDAAPPKLDDERASLCARPARLCSSQFRSSCLNLADKDMFKLLNLEHFVSTE
ncbi:hypothetical protein [Methylocella silvestris]|uniref:Uncharacterized protein n=1 Tax=Methylocella silvestris TaxID=199596 RepID=A0A2J7TIX6_METSI|nr:hypothetical protein [Methylocella silvestris]PNG26723.1 hypothetical protein CR492_06960 [Methylocella silvestris]